MKSCSYLLVQGDRGGGEEGAFSIPLSIHPPTDLSRHSSLIHFSAVFHPPLSPSSMDLVNVWCFSLSILPHPSFSVTVYHFLSPSCCRRRSLLSSPSVLKSVINQWDLISMNECVLNYSFTFLYLGFSISVVELVYKKYLDVGRFNTDVFSLLIWLFLVCVSWCLH